MPGAKSLHTDEPDTSPLSSISAWNDSVAELKRQATKTIYVHSRVIYVGHVDLTSQTFFCRFDLFVAWDPKECGTTETFDPFLRMPQSESWSELFRFPLETPAGRVGFRATCVAAPNVRAPAERAPPGRRAPCESRSADRACTRLFALRAAAGTRASSSARSSSSRSRSTRRRSTSASRWARTR